MMTPKARTVSDYLSGEFTDVNTGAIVNPDLLQRQHMYMIPDDVKGGKVYSNKIRSQDRYQAFFFLFGIILGVFVGYVLHSIKGG